MHHLVFDFGAVVFHWQPEQLVTDTFPDVAATPAAARQLARAIFADADWHAFDRGHLSLQAVAARTAQRLALPQARLLALMAGIGDDLRPIDGTVAVLADLRQRRRTRGDLRLYYLSNMPALYARTLQRRHGFLGWFDGGVFSGDVQLGKPDPAIYELLQSRYALDPARTWFVDDVQENVDVARALGWSSVRFVSTAQLRSSLADWLP